MSDTCPTCGSPVKVISDPDGTSFYEPVAERDEAREALRELVTCVEDLLSLIHI